MFRLLLVFLTMYILLSPSINCFSTTNNIQDDTTFSSLNTVVNSSASYNNTSVAVEGYYIQSFEQTILANDIVENPDGSFFASGSQIWLYWGITRPIELIEQTLKEYVLRGGSPPMKYGRVRVLGVFRSGKNFGHLGQYNNSITVQKIYFLHDHKWIPAVNN